MQESRALIVKRKPRIILDTSFPIKDKLKIGDKGQMVITGTIEAERFINEDDTDFLVKTILIEKAELVENKPTRT